MVVREKMFCDCSRVRIVYLFVCFSQLICDARSRSVAFFIPSASDRSRLRCLFSFKPAFAFSRKGPALS